MFILFQAFDVISKICSYQEHVLLIMSPKYLSVNKFHRECGNIYNLFISLNT